MAWSESNLDLRRLGNRGERMEVWDTAAPDRMKKTGVVYGGAQSTII